MTASPDPGRLRTQRWRARLRGELPPLGTCACGTPLRTGRLLCSRCWKRTPEGRARNAERMRQRRAKSREE